MSDTKPYNPLDKNNLGNSVATALLKQPLRALSDTAGLTGAGVYALYYTGPYELYQPISAANANQKYSQPIYVGKAIPRGGRKGGLTQDASKGTPLQSRINKHAKSISAAKNLELVDFSYRCLVVDDIWIPLGENTLIEVFRPLWNMVVDGFGINDPGQGRYNQARSQWDTLHPGRAYAEKCRPGALTEKEIGDLIMKFFAGQYAPEEPVDDGSEQ